MTPSHTLRVPKLSIVVIVYSMRREAPRTLLSLSAAYQQTIDPQEYEVLVVENGSAEPLEAEQVGEYGDNFRYIRLETASSSPVPAINHAVSQARGRYVGLMIDGARIVTPCMLHFALLCLTAFPRALVGSLGFHLGPDYQHRSIDRGYDAQREDELLASIDWPNDGYRLFEIAALAESSRYGWLGCPAESNCVFLPKVIFHELGGFDESFDLPGGGFANLDFWVRACELPSTTLITLLGEGSFHQVHGGVATNTCGEERAEWLRVWADQYVRIRGKPFASPQRRPLLFGKVHAAALPWLRRSLELSETGRSERAAKQRPSDEAPRTRSTRSRP